DRPLRAVEEEHRRRADGGRHRRAILLGVAGAHVRAVGSVPHRGARRRAPGRRGHLADRGAVKAVVVLTTVGAGFDAAALAKSLVAPPCVACAHNTPEVRSLYRWKNAVEDDREQLLVIKTTEERVDALREALFAAHPYEVPEFVVLDAGVHSAYGAWLAESVRASE